MRTEILSPAGNKESFISAIHHGCDAIYIGGLKFGARAQAQNFTIDEIIELINYAHLYEVKVYVTVNTLIKDEEFLEAVSFVKQLYINNVDAIIVQDIGLASYLLKVFPDIVLHASTQMNIHSFDQALFLKNLGFKRIVLARECKYELIKKIKQEIDIELEVFVHGALCMSYSGNCLMSSVIGKRSGNRGKCAQPCRLLYSLNDSNKPSYLLSPKDLMTLNDLDKLLDLNIDSLKIEGRMKRKEYVGLVTQIYKEKVNSYYNKQSFDLEKNIKDLKEIFNRQFTKGYIFNESNKQFTNTKYSNHIGVKLGVVNKVENNYIFIKLEEQLNNGDSIRIVGRIEDAVTISEMYIKNVLVKSANIGDVVKIRCHKKVEVNSLILKTTNIKLLDSVNKYEEKKIYIDGSVFVSNKKLVLKLIYKDLEILEHSTREIEYSENNNFKIRLYEQINKTNSTIYKFNKLDIDVDNIFVPISVVNELRRNAICKLNNKRLEFKKKRIVEINNSLLKDYNNEFSLFVKVNNINQYKIARNIFDGIIITEDKDIYLNNQNDSNLAYINPRIEVNKVIEGGVQNYNLLRENNSFTGVYLNVFNSYSLGFYHNLGIDLVGLSIELSSKEIGKLIKEYKIRYNSNPNTYILGYGRYELMIMKHCLINKSLNLDNLGCNKCLEKQYYLKDRLGFKFPLIKARGCNVKLLNSKVLNLINNIDEIKSLGVNKVLLDFTIEDEYEVEKVLSSFIKKVNGEDVKLEINDVTYGHFNEGVL